MSNSVVFETVKVTVRAGTVSRVTISFLFHVKRLRLRFTWYGCG